MGMKAYLRSREELVDVMEGWTLVKPGIVRAGHWGGGRRYAFELRVLVGCSRKFDVNAFLVTIDQAKRLIDMSCGQSV
jgi:hypothetical protein